MIVVAEKVGRLANRLFLFAHLVAFAHEHGVSVANPAFDEYAAYFPAFRDDPLCRYPPRRGLPLPGLRRASLDALALLARNPRAHGPLPVVRAEGDELDLRSEAFLAYVRRGRPVVVRGWRFRDYRSFDLHADLLRSLFTPAVDHMTRARRRVAEARGKHDLLVGLHVRRRDYDVWANGRYLYGAEQYRAMVDGVRALFPDRDMAILGCSDDPAFLPALGDDVVQGPGHPVEDLYALAGCDLVVGPPSTYSSWASFHGAVPLLHVSDPAAPISIEAFRVAAG